MGAGAMVDPSNLADASTLARELGVSGSAIHNWAARHPSFPRPVVELPGHRLWDRGEVVAWAGVTGHGART